MQNNSVNDNIIPFRKKKTIFKNANKINFKTGQVELVDIRLDGEVIDAIEPAGKLLQEGCEIVDLQANFVMQPFVNIFCDSVKALKETYGLEIKGMKAERAKEILNGIGFKGDVKLLEAYPNMLMAVKNLLAGASIALDFAVDNKPNWDGDLVCVENVEKLSESQLDEIVEKTTKNRASVFLKVGQTLDELGCIDKAYRKTLSQVLEDFGFLDRSPVIVGGNCLEKDELSLLKDYGCRFVVCPSEDGKAGRRMTNINALKNLDFRVGLGSGYSFEIDFFAFMRQIIMSMRGLYEDKNIITEQDVLKMATDNGAKIVLGQKIKIEVGQKANFIVVKNEGTLYDDIFKTLVWEKSKKDVLMTISNGKILQKNGEIFMQNQVDYDKIKLLVKKFSQKIEED